MSFAATISEFLTVALPVGGLMTVSMAQHADPARHAIHQFAKWVILGVVFGVFVVCLLCIEQLPGQDQFDRSVTALGSYTKSVGAIWQSPGSVSDARWLLTNADPDASTVLGIGSAAVIAKYGPMDERVRAAALLTTVKPGGHLNVAFRSAKPNKEQLIRNTIETVLLSERSATRTDEVLWNCWDSLSGPTLQVLNEPSLRATVLDNPDRGVRWWAAAQVALDEYTPDAPEVVSVVEQLLALGTSPADPSLVDFVKARVADNTIGLSEELRVWIAQAESSQTANSKIFSTARPQQVDLCLAGPWIENG